MEYLMKNHALRCVRSLVFDQQSDHPHVILYHFLGEELQENFNISDLLVDSHYIDEHEHQNEKGRQEIRDGGEHARTDILPKIELLL